MHDVGTGVGHGRTARLGDDTHGLARLQGLEVRGYRLGRGVLVEFIEGKLVNIDIAVYFLQETACRAYVLDDEVAYAHDDVVVVCGEHLLYGRVAQGAGDEI